MAINSKQMNFCSLTGRAKALQANTATAALKIIARETIFCLFCGDVADTVRCGDSKSKLNCDID